MSKTTVYKQDDRLPEYTATLMQGDNTAIDLTSTTVEFHMTNRATGVIKVEAAATIVSATAGTVKYAWAATDLDTVGIYDVEWEILFSGSRVMTVPAKDFDVVKVIADLA